MGEYQPAAMQDEYYAAVDLGSNSFHMVTVRVLSGSVQIVSKNKQKVRLAAGLNDDNELSEEAIARGLNCIRNFAEKLQDIPPKNIKIVATATLRLATNSKDFVVPAERILNHKVNIISGDEEAKQIYLGVAYTSANQGNTLVIDIGGASTEVVIGRDLQPLHLTSFNMGCVTFMEKYFPEGNITAKGFNQALSEASKIMQSHVNTFRCFDWGQCLGASGTPQAVTSILVKRGVSDAIRLDYLHKLKDECIAAGHINKLIIEGLASSRQAIFPSGLAILIALFENLQIENMQISGGALREGIIYGMLETYQKSDRRQQGLNQLISRFHIDAEQSKRTQKIASALCKTMCDQTNFCDFDTEVVTHAAASLHEIGLHIGFKGYNEHGAYILTHVDVTGFTNLQRMMIKDLVLLHRGEIDLSPLTQYKNELKQTLINAMRVLRIAIILTSRRRSDAIPTPRLNINENEWNLTFSVDLKSRHPMIYTELVHECWLQHRAGWQLKITEAA
ncbi:guanosine-5'-triphosphate,3'-diphosphate pyrophosphatase [Agaribacter marinus]|uniref:Guanosine-5'-triphosphate,3'-diphosphate pyrophosphatase n=1 Tax=Agaribacter marinus TaxID=1431249 RepID=A0AA37T6J9_9ALTE|nr:guanosine-5'-triphosphate,3'-diphosphate pyrophosphatase [Agaribacter marinus]GLR72415.1 guanosine-5'-triphosphate,3'-diphosphate pyrophosphatase [Agaribacter marinus]